jgi:hypothetical protein
MVEQTMEQVSETKVLLCCAYAVADVVHDLAPLLRPVGHDALEAVTVAAEGFSEML